MHEHQDVRSTLYLSIKGEKGLCALVESWKHELFKILITNVTSKRYTNKGSDSLASQTKVKKDIMHDSHMQRLFLNP